MRRILLTVILIAALLTGCTSPSSAGKSREITISAAASLADALTDVAKSYTEKTGVQVHLNFASSGSLEKQIEEGAPVDLFFSASEEYTHHLIQNGWVDKTHTQPLLANELVLIVPKDSTGIHTLENLKNAKSIAIGTPDIVPAGQYAKQALTSLNLWKPLEPKLVNGKDVRQVLSYVETGNADAGLVYKSDALISSKVKVVQTLPAASHEKIVYPCAVIKHSANKKNAEKMFKFLQSKTAAKTFKKYGFEPIKKE